MSIWKLPGSVRVCNLFEEWLPFTINKLIHNAADYTDVDWNLSIMWQNTRKVESEKYCFLASKNYEELFVEYFDSLSKTMCQSTAKQITRKKRTRLNQASISKASKLLLMEICIENPWKVWKIKFLVITRGILRVLLSLVGFRGLPEFRGFVTVQNIRSPADNGERIKTEFTAA